MNLPKKNQQISKPDTSLYCELFLLIPLLSLSNTLSCLSFRTHYDDIQLWYDLFAGRPTGLSPTGFWILHILASLPSLILSTYWFHCFLLSFVHFITSFILHSFLISIFIFLSLSDTPNVPCSFCPRFHGLRQNRSIAVLYILDLLFILMFLFLLFRAPAICAGLLYVSVSAVLDFCH